MEKPKKDKEREERITMEIVVDANGPEEQALGWYYYLEDKLNFPFTAICNEKRAISPLLTGQSRGTCKLRLQVPSLFERSFGLTEFLFKVQLDP